MEVDADGRIVGFEEKPKEPKTIPGTTDCLASMGIYLFDADCLRRSLDNDLPRLRQGRHPAPHPAGEAVYAYDFTSATSSRSGSTSRTRACGKKELVPVASDCDYWRDVGTLEQYWLANLDLVQPAPRFNVYGERFALFSAPHHFPAGEVRPRDPRADGRRRSTPSSPTASS